MSLKCWPNTAALVYALLIAPAAGASGDIPSSVQRLTSWSGTAEKVTADWLAGAIARPYALRTLRKAADQLVRAADDLARDSAAATPEGERLQRRLAFAGDTAQGLCIAIERGAPDAAARLAQDLKRIARTSQRRQ